ncbi:MAG: DUF488 family protein [Rhizobiales bacterium]|nr:DUF488 family protein [Hyphomicrobiales bacterium]
MSVSTTIHLKRAYDPADANDGLRILVERLWPRGVRKEDLALDHWAKQIAPSPDLRTWYGHVPDRWAEFSERYRSELAANSSEVADLARRIDGRVVSFLFAARDVEYNSAVVLKAFMQERLGV